MSAGTLARFILASFIIIVTLPIPGRAQNPLKICARGEGGKETHSSNIHTDDEKSETRWVVSWSRDGCSVDMRARGTIRFKRDLSDVESISRGGYFEITHREDGVTRRYEASAEGGDIERHYTVNRREQELDAEGRRWLATVILEFERSTGFVAEWRVSDLLRNGGVDAVLREVRLVRSDYVQKRYLTILLDSARLGDAQVKSVIQVAGEEVGSDYELTTFLMALAKRGYVTEAIAPAFVTATGTIRSDYEKRRALSAVLTLQRLPAAVVVSLLDAAATVKSDYERAELLLATAKVNGLPGGRARDSYLTAASSIRSDYEKRRVLGRLVSDTALTEEQLVALLTTSTSIGSDYELATLLVDVAKRHVIDGRARDAYLRAAETIASDHENRRALSALVRSSATRM